MKRYFLFFFAALFILGIARAQTITTAVPFLLICPDARAAAMGETGLTSSPDANAVHWNAAKLVFAEKKMGVSISYTPRLRALYPDMNHFYVPFYFKANDLSAIGGSVRYFSMGKLNLNVAGSSIGEYKPTEFAVDFCYARKISSRFSIAASVRYIRSNLANGLWVNGKIIEPGNVFAMDISAYFSNGSFSIGGKKVNLSSGIALTNMGSKISYFVTKEGAYLPANIRLGEGLQTQFGANHQLGIQVELNKLMVPGGSSNYMSGTLLPIIDPHYGMLNIISTNQPNTTSLNGMLLSFSDSPGGMRGELREITVGNGLEYWYKKMIAVRCGYFYEYRYSGDRQFMTLGAGVHYSAFGLDFAYLIPTNTKRSPLQNTFHLTLQFEPASLKKKSES